MGVEGLTYHEKKALGFGTVKQRLGKVLHTALPYAACMQFTQAPHFITLLRAVAETGATVQDSVGNYYDCRLTLQPAVVSAIAVCQGVCSLQAEQCTWHAKHPSQLADCACNSSSLTNDANICRTPSAHQKVSFSARKPSSRT